MHGQTDEQMDDGHNAMTIARWPLASGAKNIKLCNKYFFFLFYNVFFPVRKRYQTEKGRTICSPIFRQGGGRHKDTLKNSAL